MTKKITLSILITFLVLIMVFVGAIFYASKVLTPEKMNLYAQLAVAKVMPGADLEIGKIELHFGPTIRAEVDELNLKLKEKAGTTPLLSFKGATIRIPLWAIFTGGGTVQLKLQSPNIYYNQIGKKDNWQLALDQKNINQPIEHKTTTSKEKQDAAKPESTVAIPAIAAAVQLNIQVEDLHLKYALLDKSRGDIVIDRLLVKQLGLATTTAFEMHSNFKFVMANKEEFAVQPMLIGEFNLTEFLSKGEINSKMQLALQNISLGKLPVSIPNIKTNFSVNVNKLGEITGDISTSFASSRIASHLALAKNGDLLVDKIEALLQLSDILTMIKDMPLPIDMKSGASTFQLSGKVKMSNGRIDPNLQFRLTSGLAISVDGMNAAITADGGYDGKKIKLHSAIELLKGIISADLSGLFDINQKVIALDKLSPFRLTTKISNIELSDTFIRSKIYTKKDVVEEVPVAKVVGTKNAAASAKNTELSLPLLPPGLIELEMVNLKVGSNALNGKGRVRIENRAVVTDFMNFTYGGGTLELTHRSSLQKNALANQFTADLRSFNLLAIRPFLPQFIDAVTGIFSGKVKGKVDLDSKGFRYYVDANVEARSGAIQGLKIGQFIEGFADRVPMLKGKSLDVDSEKLANYELFTFNGQLTDKVYKVNMVEFIAVNKLVEIKGKGEVYPPPTKGNSALYLTYSDSKYLSRVLMEATKSKTLPVLLKGVEFDLMPDYMYSTQALMKGAGKKAAAKATEKAKEILKESGKKEVKKLLKSFGL